MKKYLLLLYLSIFVFGCCIMNNTKTMDICSEERALSKADSVFKKKSKSDINDYKKVIEDSTDFFVVHYYLLPKNTEIISKGGGGKIIISKADCSVFKIEIYR